ncbi:unnamed protein product [Leptosia nina]|uniref:Uncharacterized protein n=1 Tax=Leptosia nina TaxID=320188 RepID=A0AAV1JYW0_9NEOP
MSGNDKKKSSFRKIFPFLYSKSKDKRKEVPHIEKLAINNNQASNQYQNPQNVVSKNDRFNVIEQNDRIYENLCMTPTSCKSHHQVTDTYNSTKRRQQINEEHHTLIQSKDQYSPQTSPIFNNSQHPSNMSYYPDIYYHSVERLADKVLVVDREVLRASQVRRDPESVGAEIRKVSTKFLVSPKKEATVRTMKPIRANSFSIRDSEPVELRKVNRDTGSLRRAYHYSAPTSPISVGHRIPTMPTTVSPDEKFRKSLLEAEVSRTSLSRTSERSKSTPPTSLFRETDSPILYSETKRSSKEVARQKVEAFYWQKIKEMKDQDDLNLLQNLLPLKYNTLSTSNTINTGETTYLNSPFRRGVPERRTDTYIHSSASYYTDPQKSNSVIVGNQTPARGTPPIRLRRNEDNISITSTNSKLSKCSKNTSSMNTFSTRPPVPPVRTTSVAASNKTNENRVHLDDSNIYFEYESGSEAAEIQRILRSDDYKDEDTKINVRNQERELKKLFCFELKHSA